MMARGPGFLDDPSGDEPEKRPREADAIQPFEPAVGPILFDPIEGEARTRIDPNWEPDFAARPKARSSSLALVVGGLVVLLLSWILISLIGFAEDQFRRSTGLGLITVICFAAAIAMIGYGLAGEVSAWRALRKVDDLRRRLSGTDISATDLQVVILPWVRSVRRHLDKPERVEAMIETATSPREILATLRQDVAGPLEQVSTMAGRRAALEGAAVIAITPAPALEGILAGARGLLLIREIAGIYGLRPGLLVTLALLRRVALTAASVSGVALASQKFTEHIVHKVPLIRDLASAAPEVSLTAIRLYRLASNTAAACSPLPDDSEDLA